MGRFMPRSVGIGRASIPWVNPDGPGPVPVERPLPVSREDVSAADQALARAMAARPANHWLGAVGNTITQLHAMSERDTLREQHRRQLAEAMARDQQGRATFARGLGGEQLTPEQLGSLSPEHQIALRKALAGDGGQQFRAWHNPESGETGSARAGSPEAAALSERGFIPGAPPQRAQRGPGDVKAYFNPETREVKAVRAGTPEEDSLVQAGYVPGRPPQVREGAETPANLRKEFSKESKVFIDTQDQYRVVTSAFNRKTAAGDLAALFAFMKTLDPMSVVRESEFRQAAAAGDYGERIQGAVLQALEGRRLTDTQRVDFLATAKEAYMGRADQQARKRAQYTGIAEASGLSPDQVLINYIDKDLYNPDETPAAAPEDAAQTQQAAAGGSSPAPAGETAPEATPEAAAVDFGGLDSAQRAQLTPEELERVDDSKLSGDDLQDWIRLAREAMNRQSVSARQSAAREDALVELAAGGAPALSGVARRRAARR